jgi:exosome complex RNA-binding protein Csl4
LKLRTAKNGAVIALATATTVHLTTREDSMECPKCKGLMMLERFSDFFLIFYAWKCVNCGAIIDRTISNNRRKSLAARDSQTVATR